MTPYRFLLELGVEEIPSQYLMEIRDSLQTLITTGLQDARILAGDVEVLATPRRLTAHGVILDRQEAQQETIRGPLVSVAYDASGSPTPALRGFCRKVSLEPEALGTLVEGAKTYLAAVIAKPQALASEILPQVMQKAFSDVALPRSMRWGNEDWRFIRPVRWVALWFNQTLLPITIAGTLSTPITYGNRTDHPGPISYDGIDQYFAALRTGGVMASVEDRQQKIQREGNQLAEPIGAVVDWDFALLDEVANLVEWPTPFLGQFDAEFLMVPAPILVTAMKVHQRYFPLHDAKGELLPAFIGVRNGVGEHLDTVIQGNQKVLRARLADAQYFFQTDLRQRLEDRLPQLQAMLFHAKLGTYGQKLDRMAQFLVRTQSWWQLTPEEQETLHRIILLYKTDLLTHVVQEFPELQGEMGAIYARREGESELLVAALGDQYLPQYKGDRIASTGLGQWLVLVDRLDTLVMALGHGLKPTGSEDPFGIRRAALAVGRTLLEGESFLHNLSIREIIKEMTLIAQIGDSEHVIEETYDLVVQRLTSHLGEQYPVSLVRATLAADLPWNSVPDRIVWLQELSRHDRWEDVGAVFKRIDRVLPPGMLGVEVPGDIYSLAVERALVAITAKLWSHTTLGDWWEGALTVTDEVNRLFDEVLVMDPDLVIRERRMALLAWVRAGLSRYFDVSLVSAG